jgi:hypothetical protein
MLSMFRRVKALGFAKTMLEQTLAPLTMFGETIPGSIYEDPYVLGYLHHIANCGMTLATRDKLSVEDRGRVAIEAFHAIAGANGRVAVENTVRFVEEQHELYLEGQRQADLMLRVAYGRLKPSDDPEVERAFSQAEELGNLMTLTPGPPSNLNAQASAIMGRRFTEYVRANHSLRKRAADRVTEVWDDAIRGAAEKWLYFSKVIVFKDDVELREKISSFSIPAFEGLRNNFPPLKEAPESVLFLIVLKCIERSGTHSRSQIETAFGIELPD